MSDPTTDTLRRTMKAITEIAPEAPAIETISDRPGWKTPAISSGAAPRGWRGPATALVAAVAVLVMIGVGVLGVTWLRSSDSAPGDSTAAAASEGWVVLALLADGPDIDSATVDVDPETIVNALAARPGVIAVTYVTKAEAHAEALEVFADDRAMVRVLEENPDSIPASIRVLTDSHARSHSIAADAAAMTGVFHAGLYFGMLGEPPRSSDEILAWYTPPEGRSDVEITATPRASGTITLEARYTPDQDAVILSVTIINETGESIDISGWSLVGKDDEENAVHFPQGATLVSGGAASVFQYAVFEYRAPSPDCPDSTSTRIYVCFDPFRAPADLAFTSWPVLLLDGDGVLVAEWSPK